MQNTLGLLPLVELIQSQANLLRNVALCSVRAGRLHDSLAAAAASLRLRVTSKATYHLAHTLALLGELEMSQEVLDLCPTQEAAFTQLSSDVRTAAEHLRLNYPTEVMAASSANGLWKGKLLVEWVSEAIVIERIEGKGRGVRTLRPIDFGETLIVQRPRARVTADVEKDGVLLTSMNTDSGKVRKRNNNM